MRVSLSPLLLLMLALPLVVEAAPFPATASPAQLVLGRDKEVVVQVQVPRGTPPLRAAASTGSLQPLPATARGVYSYRWVPPDIRYPLLAVLAFWVDSPEGPPEVTTVHIPLLGRTTLDVATDVGAGAEVVVQIADMRFGPVKTNRKGRVQVPVEVPPGVREARVLAMANGQQTVRTARLDVPPERPLLALLSPDVLPPDGAGWLLLLGESPAPLAELELQAQGGLVEERAPGVFRVKPEAGASGVVVNARWKDGTGAARIMAPVSAPIVAHVDTPRAPLPTVKPVVAVAAPSPVLKEWLDVKRLSVHLLAGGFFAGGDNLGPLAAVGVGYRLPPLGGRLFVEGEAGLRQSTSQPRVEPLGELNSRVVAVPVLLSARVLAYERGPLTVYGRGGAGVMDYEQRTTSSFFEKPLTQRGRTFMGFLAAQADWRLGPVSALFELRGSHAPARATQIDAQLGGLSASLGVRYAL
ncbi:MAG TPA: hypothetical protein VF794_33685 [Archangium sp.]|jgi:hypothetical protein|uniref:hypothetical protein n=1 Tax=Archangium sp. TaxID=1872627 RepID=UPI002ED9971B